MPGTATNSSKKIYSFGMVMPGCSYNATSSYRFGFNKGSEKDNEIYGKGNTYTTQFRELDTRIGIWWGRDPEPKAYESPYVSMGDNPIWHNDVRGNNANPIFDKDKGVMLGTDDKGLQGNAITMDKKDFQQGMAHEDALKKGTEYTSDQLNKASWAPMPKITKTMATLPSRLDYDGFVTIQEGIDWAKCHVGAMVNPTGENTLYIDASKLDFGNITMADFKNGVGQSTPINLNTFGNFVESSVNTTLRSTVYALGRVDITLLDNKGSVNIVNNPATDYDWNTGGGIVRSALINFERARAGVNDTHGFKTFYYGTGHLNPPAKLPDPNTVETDFVK